MKAKEFINETASVGGTSSGGITTAPAAMGTMQRRKKRIGETHDDEMVAIDFNNESAMELAYSKFDFDWDGDQMLIHEKHLGRLEELLDDHGYFEPDDYQIEPAMFAAEASPGGSMRDGEPYEVYVGEPRTGKVKVGRKTIDFDAIRLANPNSRAHLKKRGIVYGRNRSEALERARMIYGKTAQVEPWMG